MGVLFFEEMEWWVGVPWEVGGRRGLIHGEISALHSLAYHLYSSQANPENLHRV